MTAITSRRPSPPARRRSTTGPRCPTRPTTEPAPRAPPPINTRPTLPDKPDNVASPRAAALYHVSDRVSVWGAANSGFRAPTLTELDWQLPGGAGATFPHTAPSSERTTG